jgi:hypothetical protein
MFWGFLLALLAIIGDSKRTSQLINELTWDEVGIRLWKNEKITHKDIKADVTEMVTQTPFWDKASMKNKKYNFILIALILPAFYMWVKKKAFTTGFIGGEFDINWNANFAELEKIIEEVA